MSEKQQAIYSTLGGMNQSVDPLILYSDQYAMGVNISSRKGLSHTRPRFVDAGYTLPLLNAGEKYQGAFTYSLPDADRIIFGIDGNVYSLNLTTSALINHGQLLSQSVDRFFFCQASKYCVVQDGDPSTSWANANWPVIIDGDTLVDQSAISDETRVPKGSAMAYGHGRLFVVTNYIYESSAWSVDLGAIGFVAGDIIKSYQPSDVLLFTENTYWNEGGRMEPAAELGVLHALAIQKNIISGVGSGPLLTFGEYGVSSFEVNTPRDQWKDIEIAKVMYQGSGSYSPLSFVHVNADLLFRSSHTEIRSFREAASSIAGESLVNIALSGEVTDVLARDNIAGLKLASGAFVDKRAFFTTGSQGDGTFNSLAVLDLSPIEYQQTEREWLWDGIWTGADWLGVVSGKTTTEKLYAFCLDTGVLSLVTLDDDAVVDGLATKPTCRLYTGYKRFGTSSSYYSNDDDADSFTMKQLKYIELWLSDIHGDLEITVYFRSDDFPLWAQCSTQTVKVPSTGFAHTRKHLRFTPDRDSGDPSSGDSLFSGYSFQFCIQWKGKMKLDKARFVVEEKEKINEFKIAEEDTTASAIVTTSSIVDLDDYEYRFAL